MFKKEFLIIFAGLSAVVAILVLSWAVFVKSIPVVPIQPPVAYKNEIISDNIEDNDVSDDDTSDWQIYRNEEYGFEMKYPEDWEQNKEEIIFSKTFINSKGQKNGAYFSVEVFDNLTSIPLEEWINIHDPIFIEDGKELHFQKNIVIDGNSGIYRKITNSISGGYQNDAFIQHDDFVYKINMDLYILLPEGKQKEKEFYDILEQMLNSFKFDNP